MARFPQALVRAAAFVLLVGALGVGGGGSASATTVNFTPDNPSDPGSVGLNTTINIPGNSSGGTLSFDLTLGANYSLGGNSGASGFFNMQLDTASTPGWSFAFLTAAPSTSGTTNYGDFTGPVGVLAPGNITDTSKWTVGINPGDFPVSLSILSSFQGYCPGGAGGCFAPNATFSYNFTPNSVTAPLPAALPLFASGLGLMGWMGWRRKRKAAA
jgi:hypothetical protein